MKMSKGDIVFVTLIGIVIAVCVPTDEGRHGLFVLTMALILTFLPILIVIFVGVVVEKYLDFVEDKACDCASNLIAKIKNFFSS